MAGAGSNRDLNFPAVGKGSFRGTRVRDAFFFRWQQNRQQFHSDRADLASSKKRCALIIHPSHIGAGGVVNATLFYAAALIAAGHSAEIWTASKAVAKRAENLGIPAFYDYWLRNAGMALVSPKLVGKALASRRRAAALVHQGEKSWLFGRLWFWGADQSVVFHNDKIGQRRYFPKWLTLSEQHRSELETVCREKGLVRTIQIIRNGPLAGKPQDFGLRQGDRVQTIGCLGNFGAKKAVNVLIEGFAATVARGHDVRLVLAGDGGYRKSCEALAQELGVADRIEWPGWLNDTTAFFQQIDLFCLPSRNEPFGIVITEAMQAGLPVIATDTKGPRDIVIPGETGWLVPPDRPDALAGAIEEAILDPVKAAAFGQAGRLRYQANYSLAAAGRVLADAIGL